MSAPPAATSLDEAVAATNGHYNLPPEIFAAFLGRRMKYTSGLYSDKASTLDAAQEAKLHFIADCLGIGGSESVLDVGAGWGSLTLFLAERFGCQVTAVTPAAAQAAYIRGAASAAGLDKQVRVLQRSVYDLDLSAGSFAAAAMVGSIEHMPDHHRAVATVARRLRRGGRLYLSASCYRNNAARDEFADRTASRHVVEAVFGFGTLRLASELARAVEDTGLSLIRLTDLTLDHHRTIEDWLVGVRAGRERMNALVPGLADQLIRYMNTANAAWGHTSKYYTLTAVRSRWGSPEVP